MKGNLLVCGLVGATLCTGCLYNAPGSGPIAQTYVHKYGVQVDQADWEARGQNGEIVTQLKSGVTVRTSYENGIVHGDTTYSFPHSKVVARVETFDHEQKVAEQENYRSGIPMSRKSFQGAVTIVDSWYEDGVPRSHEVVDGSFLTMGEYFAPTNSIEAQVVDGQGTRVVRNALGRVEAEETVFAGQVVTRTDFFPTGEPMAVTHLANGKRHGDRKTFLEGGLPSTIENWVDGTLEGTVVTFANGQKSAEVPYSNGIKEGVEIRYGSNGEVIERVSWHKDRLHGPMYFCMDDREAVEWYHNGWQVNKQVYDRLVHR